MHKNATDVRSFIVQKCFFTMRLQNINSFFPKLIEIEIIIVYNIVKWSK